MNESGTIRKVIMECLRRVTYHSCASIMERVGAWSQWTCTGEIDKNKDFLKNKFWLFYPKLLKHLLSAKRDWSISGWFTTFRALKFERNNAVCLFFANFNHFREIFYLLTLPKTSRCCIVFFLIHRLHILLS